MKRCSSLMGDGALLAEAAEDGLGLLENMLAAVEVVAELAVDARRSPNADGLELGGIWMLPRPMPNRGVELGEEKLLGVLKPGKPRPDAAELLRPRPSDEGLAAGLVFGSLNVSFPKPEEGLSGRLPPPLPLMSQSP
jgi:hypothetical protein